MPIMIWSWKGKTKRQIEENLKQFCSNVKMK